jgi:aspartate carbamoyltransferase catalytic subunit
MLKPLKSPSIVNNQFHENKDCASGDSLILLDEPQLSDVENKALNPASVINKEDEPSTRTSNQYNENNISESANVINLSVEKSSSCRGEQLHEIGKLTTNNKTPKELFQQTRKSSTRAHICLEGVGV